MVVVSDNWVKNVATYPSQMSYEMVINTEAKMIAKAVLYCRPNSHPFQERTLALDQPVKVGRSVARAKATPSNAIFDCKVLSRHHAVLWYENGKFYLQDTKSSNGTFVNNNRLTADSEHHEVSSGDIVQFGVDVLENNKKVTHGCIIATLKLYLPDGKEAKASPSIVENNTHVVPLNELYKLHQIIQEATQREQCLESKLLALQSVVDEARKSAEESWQAYVGEERLLSRVSALETQLQQTGKNWSEDKYREEIAKLQEDNTAYQIAAKEALEKLHGERLEAISMATERERCRISAEQEVLLVRDQLAQTQQDLEELAEKLSDEQKKSAEEKQRLEQHQWDLQTKLEIEKAEKLQLQLVNSVGVTENTSLYSDVDISFLDNHILYEDDLKTKEVLLAENDITEAEMNKVNGGDSEHINLTVAPVHTGAEIQSDDTDTDEITDEKAREDESSNTEARHVSFVLPDDSNQVGGESTFENEKDESDNDTIDSKTLKYKYQTAQNELKKKIEILESILESNREKLEDMEKSLNVEKQANDMHMHEHQIVKDELMALQHKYKESCNESQQLKDKVAGLIKKLEDSSHMDQKPSAISNHSVSYEQLVNLEEELVLLKERYAQINEEKVKLMNDLTTLKGQYNKMCNSSYDKMYFYIAPLILMILYLVISAMIS